MAEKNIGKVRKTPSSQPTINLKQQAQHDRNLNKIKGKTTEPSETMLEKVIKRFKSARSYTRKGFWSTWDDCWKLYNSERVMVGYDGNSDAFIPETFTIIQAVKAHIVGGNLQVKFLPRRDDQNGDVSVLQDLFNYAWDNDYMNQRIDDAVTEMLVTGNGYIFTFKGEEGLPSSRFVAAKDAFFDPEATCYWDMRYCGFRYLTTIDDLKDEDITNPDYDESTKSEPRIRRYRNLDNLRGFKDYGNDKTAKQEREEMVSGSTLADTEDVIECIVYIDKEKMVTIANRIEVIEDVDTPFKREAQTIQSVDDQGQPVSFEIPAIKPFLPVAPFRDYIDGNMFYAKGEVEVIGESQERLNDVQTQKADNLSYQLNRMWALDPAFAQKIDEIQSIPGAVFTIPPGALEQIPTQPIGGDADNEINRIKAEMRAATAADEIIQGQSPNRDTTAYQIRQQIAQAGTRFGVKLRTLENEGLRILAENMWKIMQIYIDKEIPVRVEGDQSVQFRNYNPGLYLGPYDVKIQLAPTAEAIKETEKQMAMQFFLLASKMPFVDQEKLFAETAVKLFDKKRQQVQELIMPPPSQPAPSIQPKLIETVKFGELYPDEQAELLAESGVTPSPMREQATGMPNPPAQPTVIPTDQQSQAGGPPPQDFNQANVKIAGQATANIPGIPQV